MSQTSVSESDRSDVVEANIDVVRELADMQECDVEHLVDEMEYKGLRKSRPTDADKLSQYVWRMARFHSGADTCMPVTASFWLQDYLDEKGIEASVTGIMDDAGKAITTFLDDYVTTMVLSELGLPVDGAAKRWEGLVY